MHFLSYRDGKQLIEIMESLSRNGVTGLPIGKDFFFSSVIGSLRSSVFKPFLSLSLTIFLVVYFVFLMLKWALRDVWSPFGRSSASKGKTLIWSFLVSSLYFESLSVGKVNPSVRGGGSTISSVQIGKALLSPAGRRKKRIFFKPANS